MRNPDALVLACAAACCTITDATGPSYADPVAVTADTRQAIAESYMGLGVQWDP